MLIFAYLKEILLAIVGFFALYLFNRNKALKAEKEVLQDNVNDQGKIINIQQRVLNETKDSYSLDSNERINKLQQYKKGKIAKSKSSRTAIN